MAYFTYVSLQEEDRIAIYTMDPESGKLSHQGDAPLAGRPAPLAIDPQKRWLFAGRRKSGEYGLTGFQIDRQTGGISALNSVPVQGDPVHISTDRQGNFLLSAYYYQARVMVHSISASGVLSDSPVEMLETDIGAHYIQTDPSNRFALVPHIAEGAHTGPNAIYQFRFDAQAGHLEANSPPWVRPEAPEGPRHVCYHPSKDIVYSSNEQGCSVTAYNFDAARGTLSPFQTVPTLPEGFTDKNSCSQIQITPSGAFLYAPNRGHNSIAGFAVDPADGRLTPLGQVSTEPVPRAFSLDPHGNFLYAAGLESGNLAAYRIDQGSGNLEPIEVYPVGGGPMWVLITEL